MLLAHTVSPVLFHPRGQQWAQGYCIFRVSPQLCQETAMPCSRVPATQDDSPEKLWVHLISKLPFLFLQRGADIIMGVLWISKPDPLANTDVCVGFRVTFPHHCPHPISRAWRSFSAILSPMSHTDLLVLLHGGQGGGSLHHFCKTSFSPTTGSIILWHDPEKGGLLYSMMVLKEEDVLR